MEYQRRLNHEARAKRAATGLGWFSIALGLTELFGARPLARALGMKGDEGLLRLYGLREIGTGVGILTTADPAPWVWGRVAGDGLDVATLLAYFEDSPRKANVALALAAVAGATAADVMTAQALTTQDRLARPPVRDYSSRSGFPGGIESVRGAARKDFEIPRDMRVPEPLRPQLH